MGDMIEQLSDENFDQQVLDAPMPILIDFWAEWCGPCKSMVPILEEVASEYADRIKTCKLNVDQNRQSAERFGIRGIPTLLLFKNGKVEDTHVGLLTKSELIAFIDKNL